jgi:hypothetical protein
MYAAKVLALLACGGGLAAQNVCTVTESGSGCAALNVTLTPNGANGNLDLTLTATGLHPSSLGGMVWGMTPINVPLPFGGCPMLTDFVWGTSFMTDPSGVQVWSRIWPHSFHGYFYMQMASVYQDANLNWDIRSTSAQLVVCNAP